MEAPHNIWSILEAHADHADMVRSSKHAAPIVYKGTVLSLGRNQYKTHPIMKLYGRNDKAIYLHAEIDAILQCKDLSKAHSIHIFRQGKSGKWLLAKPCPACQTAINKTPIKKVYHT